MEGDNAERRRRADDARDRGEEPSEAGVTTGASKQHRDGDDPTHGKQDAEHEAPETRPGSKFGQGRN